MCSIFGFLGKAVDEERLARLRLNAGDRGRDGGRMERYELAEGYTAYLGNWRATPTTELERGRLQPYDGLVHNGTISNDKELGGRDGEIDSEVLARMLDRSGTRRLALSLTRVVGSYAIACHNWHTVYLAANYKPIHVWSPDVENLYFSSMRRHFEGVAPAYQSPVQLPPYSVVNLRSGETVQLPRKFAKRALVIASAGLDSTTVAYKLQHDGYQVGLLHFQYGCLAESREVGAVAKIARHLGVPLYVSTIPYTHMAGGAPIMKEDREGVVGFIKGAEYAHEWVPARNLVMLAHATAFAEANDYHVIALGNNLEEAGAYPDNEEHFTEQFGALLPNAVQNGYRMEVVAPVGNLMKHEIVKLGLALDVPYELTWSCYRDGEVQCGRCAPCGMRRMAFKRNGREDPAPFERDEGGVDVLTTELVS